MALKIQLFDIILFILIILDHTIPLLVIGHLPVILQEGKIPLLDIQLFGLILPEELILPFEIVHFIKII